MRRLLARLALGLCLASGSAAADDHAHHDEHEHGHGHGGTLTIEDFGGDWAPWHMAEEHHMANFDAGAFFTLHDFESTGSWSPAEVRKMYGLDDPSAKDVPAAKREEVTREVFKLFDSDHNGVIERREFVEQIAKGVKLPDFGLGPGHHGDDEYEYEIHHFEKYHDENTKLEDLTHPEDIAHFAKHDREDAEAERLAELNKMSVIEANIPEKFRRKPKMEL